MLTTISKVARGINVEVVAVMPMPIRRFDVPTMGFPNQIVLSTDPGAMSNLHVWCFLSSGLFQSI